MYDDIYTLSKEGGESEKIVLVWQMQLYKPFEDIW